MTWVVCYSVTLSVCHVGSHLNNSKTDCPIYVKISSNIPVDVHYKKISDWTLCHVTLASKFDAKDDPRRKNAKNGHLLPTLIHLAVRLILVSFDSAFNYLSNWLIRTPLIHCSGVQFDKKLFRNRENNVYISISFARCHYRSTVVRMHRTSAGRLDDRPDAGCQQ